MQNKYLLLLVFLMGSFFTVRAQLDMITQVNLTFTPTAGNSVTASATDNGNGLVPDGPIVLMESTNYTLNVSLLNGTTDLTSTVSDNGNQYQLFFQPSGSVISGDITATDNDNTGLPIGLENSLTSECTGEGDLSGMLRVVLADLGDGKSVSSSIGDGTNIFDLNWDVTLVDDPQAPPCENEEEIITDVILSWIPTSGGDTIVARAQDPDGEGPLDLLIDGPINLDESTDYNLMIQVRNEIEGEDITEEIREEDEEHMFFFAWTDEVFRSPAGDGNADNRMDPVDYQDADINGLPLGLSTNWTTECTEANTAGTFRLVLKHQPGVKSATSTINDGGTDIDLTWTLNVVDDPDAPACENEEEIITDVILSWIPTSGGDTIVARAQDPDGEGPLDLLIDGPINLDESTDYNLMIQVRNEIEGEDITEEIREEDEEHMFFFAWTEGIFSNPAGDGNIDMRGDAVNYNDQDSNGLPLGLSTAWTTTAQNQNGTFRIVLKHQPDSKSASSTVADGGTDIDLTWNINTVVTNTHQQMIRNQDLRIFPNPAQNQLNWRLQGTPTQTPEIRIMDSFGRVVRYYANPTVSIPISDLPQGTYLLQAKSGQRIWIQPFVKL